MQLTGQLGSDPPLMEVPPRVFSYAPTIRDTNALYLSNMSTQSDVFDGHAADVPFELPVESDGLAWC